MRNFSIVFIVILLSGVLAQTAGANTYGATNYVGSYSTQTQQNVNGQTTYTYTTNALDSLDHGYFYTWGITSPNLGANDVIQSATLIFSNIYNWKNEKDEPNNILYVDLLDNPQAGIYSGSDTGVGDQFSNIINNGKGISLKSWHDKDGETTKDTVTITISDLTTLRNYMSSNSIFGFGVDPDCHFWDNGATFILVTKDPVPEPVSMLLFGTGLVGLAGFQTRKRAKH